MNGHTAMLLLGATWGLPLAMLLACLSVAVRSMMPRLLALAPLPGLAAAAFALHAPALEIGAGRLRLVFELDGPGALLLGVAALLWSAAGAYARSKRRSSSFYPCARTAGRTVFALCRRFYDFQKRLAVSKNHR